MMEYIENPTCDTLAGKAVGDDFAGPCDYSGTGWALWRVHAEGIGACTCRAIAAPRRSSGQAKVSTPTHDAENVFRQSGASCVDLVKE